MARKTLDPRRMRVAAETASALMKTLGHSGRLMILCQLAEGEKSVSQLEELLDISQSPLSQHLARLRREGLVSTRRSAQTIYYALTDNKAGKVIQYLYELYCPKR